jgi:hypothetical protein
MAVSQVVTATVSPANTTNPDVNCTCISGNCGSVEITKGTRTGNATQFTIAAKVGSTAGQSCTLKFASPDGPSATCVVNITG